MSDFIALALMETPTMTLLAALVTFLVGVLVGSIGLRALVGVADGQARDCSGGAEVDVPSRASELAADLSR
jgi:hypothetical protein